MPLYVLLKHHSEVESFYFAAVTSCILLVLIYEVAAFPLLGGICTNSNAIRKEISKSLVAAADRKRFYALPTLNVKMSDAVVMDRGTLLYVFSFVMYQTCNLLVST